MTQTKSSVSKTLLRIVLPLVLGGGILYLLYRNTDWSEVQEVISNQLDYPILLLSLVFGLVANIIRGLRWELLLPPIISEGEAKPKRINAILTVLGSYTVNMVIPRAGELWRCAEFKRYEGLPFSALLGTLINDRLADVLSLALILLGVLLGYHDFFLSFFAENPEQLRQLQGILSSPWLYVAGGVGLLTLVGLLYFLRKRPENKLSQIIVSIIEGIMSIRAMKKRGLFLLYSLLIWLCYFLFFYISFWAFPFTKELGPSVGLIAFALSSMSVLAPVQAGMGPWHFMVITTLTAYGVAQADAGAFALIVHSVQTLWITLVGLVAILALPLVNRHYQRV